MHTNPIINQISSYQSVALKYEEVDKLCCLFLSTTKSVLVVARGVLSSLNEEFPVLSRCLYFSLLLMRWFGECSWAEIPRKSTFLGVCALGTQAQPLGPAWKVKPTKIILVYKPANLNW